MSLDSLVAQLDQFLAQAEQAFGGASNADELEAARVNFLGAKSGQIKQLQKMMGTLAAADRPVGGKRFNEVKQAVEQAWQAAKSRIESGATAGPTGERFDVTLPGLRPRLGHFHPITQTIEELKDIMGRLGFSVADGPEIEDEWHNFEALNIPAEHPARDPQDNFYLTAPPAAAAAAAAVCGAEISARSHRAWSGAKLVAQHSSTSGQANTGPANTAGQAAGGSAVRELLLRSQTSTVQIRVMEQTPPPVRIISLGRVYRPDTADATHYPMFHQMEGLLIDRRVTMADLKSVLRLFATTYLGRDVHIRFRPSFFPFTEPSVEADFSWNQGWVEFGGAGMVDPNVLRAVGYDPDEVSGFAFGLGVERLCMRRHGVTDIREFYKNDVRFLHQF